VTCYEQGAAISILETTAADAGGLCNRLAEIVSALRRQLGGPPARATCKRYLQVRVDLKRELPDESGRGATIKSRLMVRSADGRGRIHD